MAKDIYVKSDGNNANSGLVIGSPVQTRSHALGLAVSGDRILTYSGDTFSGQLTQNKSGIEWDVYGGSEKSIFSGFVTLTGWTNQGNGIWSKSESSLGSTLKQVTIDGVSIPKGRYPKFNPTDHGFLPIQSGTSTTLTATSISSMPNYVGAELVFKSIEYAEDIVTITGQSGSTFTYSGTVNYGGAKGGYGFFVQNHIATLTEFGEWAYDASTKTVSMYFGSENPNSYTIKASSTSNLVTVSGNPSDVQYNNIAFEGSNLDALLLTNSSNFSLTGCDIRQTGQDGVFANNHQYMSVNDCDFYDINNNAFFLGQNTDYSQIDYSRIREVGMHYGMLKGGLGCGIGIHIPWFNSSAEHNHVWNCGQTGIRYEKAYTKCNYNHVHHASLRFSDAGLIYNWNGSTNNDKQPGMRCIGNIVYGAPRVNQGTNKGSQYLNHGIYQDDHTSGAPDNLHQIKDNFVFDIEGVGIFLHNSESFDITGNTVFNCNHGLQISSDTAPGGERMEDLHFRNNIMVAKTANQTAFFIFSNQNDIPDMVNSPSDWDYNVLARPILDTDSIRIQAVSTTTLNTLAQWQAMYGWDANSTKSPIAISSTDQFRVETNPDETSKVVDLSDGTYIDMYGVEQTSTITLDPHSGILIIKTGDTPPPVDVFKRIYLDGFIYNQSQNDLPDIDGILPNDTIGSTSQLPNEPSGLDLSETVFFDTTVKRTASSNGSAKFIADIEKRWFNNNESYKTFRYQHVVVTHYLRTEEIWFGFSLLFPENFDPDTHETIVYNFGGVGGGAFSLRINNGYFHLSISRLDENTTSNRLIFVLEEANGGVWHDFIVKAKWSHNTADGELTVWKNGKLARLYNPVTRQKWIIPTSTTSGIQSQYIAFPAKGYIDQTVEDEGLTVSVLNWKGFTLGISEGGIDHNFRTGFYYSGWNTNIDPVTGEVRPETYEQGNPLYIEPNMRIREMWVDNVGWQPKNSYTENLPHEELYTSLDANNQPPLEKANWWADDEPVEITYPANNRSFLLGTLINIETNNTEGDVDFFVNNNLIKTVSESPYSISISDIPLNDSIVDLHFDENLLNWGTGSNSISPVNAEDISYEIGPRNHAINLGNNVLHNQKSFLVIENSGPLSEISNEFTISFWIKSNHGSGLNPYIVHNIESVDHSGIRISVLSGGEINVYLYDGTGDAPITFRTTLNSIVSPSEYRHFAITYDGNELKWYYNLELDSQKVVGEVDISPTANWHINASSINQAGRQQLSLDDFRIYNYSISEEDIYKTAEDNFLGQLELKIRRLGVESDPVTINIVESIDEYEVTVIQTSGGVVTGSGVYEDGTQATLTATPNTGWHFVRWSNDVTDNPYSFTVTGDVTLQAIFAQNEPSPEVIIVKGKFRIV